MSERSLPHNVQAEMAVLGSVLIDRDAIIPIASWLHPEHFYQQKHGDIFAVMVQLYEEREPPDLVTVSERLRRMDKLDRVGGVPYLIELSNSTPTSAHVEFQARIVERTAVLRRLIQAGGKIAALGFDETDDIEQTLGAAEQELFAVTQRRQVRGYATIGQVIDEYYDRFDRLVNEGAPQGLPTGFYDLDRLLLFAPSDLVIVAARPGVGKTSLMLAIAWHLAHAGHTVGIFSLEMDRQQLLQRQLAGQAGVDTQKFRTGRFDQSEIQEVVSAMGEQSALPILIDDTPDMTLSAIRSTARRMRAERGIEIAFVDYLGKVKGSEKSKENRVQEVSEIARDLKNMARELRIPVVALAQMSRAVEHRADRRPQLSDLRDSGEIEQEADAVLFIYREEMTNADTDRKGTAEIIVEKNRHGPLGTATLRFDARSTKFDNLSYATVGY